jgi:HK97 family phage prohead protease
MADTFRPPQGVRDEAKRALAWIADGKAGSGFTDVGRARAVQLSRGDVVSAETIVKMFSYLSRHEVDKQGKGFSPNDEGYPSAGRVAWAAWGGDAGFTWSSKIHEQLSARAALLEGESMESRDMVVEVETISNLPEELSELLGTAVQFYFRAHGAHWNVKGADFSEYHKLFQKIYETAYELIDPIAENLRKIGEVAPFRLAEFMMLWYLQDATPGQDPMSLARDLLTANDIFLDQLSDVFDCATNYNQQGIANFIAGAIDDQQFYKWQLTASLGEEVTQPSPDPVDAQGNDLDDMAEESMPMMSEAYPMARAADAQLDVGTFVSWNSSGGRSRGKIEKVATKGALDSSDGFSLEATPDSPVFLIRIYSENGTGYAPSDKTVVHRSDVLTVIKALPAPRSAEPSEGLMIEERKSAIASAERITFEAEVRAIVTDDGSLRIGGYAAQFNKEATGLNFREMIAPGAFTRSLKSGDPVFLLVNHDTDQLPLASTQGGTLVLSEDEVGLRMEATLDPSNPRAAELASALTRGDVDKMSFAFTVAPGGDTREEGLRTLTDLNLFEVSVVTWPAYDASSVGMRSEDSVEDDLELRKRLIALKFKLNSL